MITNTDKVEMLYSSALNHYKKKEHQGISPKFKRNAICGNGRFTGKSL